MNLREIREKYPQYDNLTDDELARGLHQKFYPQLDFKDFSDRIGFLKGAKPEEYDATSKEYQAKYGATSGGGEFRPFGIDTGVQTPQWLDRTAAGAGKAFYDVGRGAKQLTGNLSREEVDERQATDAPLMQTGAGRVGNVIGNIGVATPTMLIPGVNTYTGAALVGGGLGALQPVGTGESRTLNTALGAGGGIAGKFVGDRIAGFLRPAAANAQSQARAAASATPGEAAAENAVSVAPELQVRTGGPNFGTVGDDASAGLTQAQREVMQRGQAMGMRLTPGQATGSKALQQLEAKLESQPMTSGPFNTIKAHNARVAARAVAQSIGENADEVSSAVLDRAATRISNVFRNAGDDAVRAIDPDQLLTRVSNIEGDLEGVVSGFSSHPLVTRLLGLAEDGSATGRQLHSLTSKIGNAAYSQMTSKSGDRNLGLALYQIKDYVDDLLMQGMEPARRTTFQAARTQYRNLLMLTSRTGVVNPSTGNVSGRSLANVLASKDKAGFMYGRNASPMYDAARFAQAFAPIVGDSGTATRAPIQGLTELAMRIPMNVASRAYTSSPAVNLAVGAQAAGQATQRTLGPVLGPGAQYAPYLLPGVTGILAPELASQ